MNQELRDSIVKQSGGFYNQERKIAFVDWCNENMDLKSARNRILNLFESSSVFENLFGKDLCEFSFEEGLALFVGSMWYKRSYFYSIKSTINNYCGWCCENKFIQPKQNGLKQLSRPDVLNEVIGLIYPFRSQIEFKQFFWNVFEMNDPDCMDMNAMRWCSVLLAWDGLTRDEIFELKKEDIINGEAVIAPKNKKSKERRIKLSEDTLEAIQQCNHMISIKIRKTSGYFSIYDLKEKPEIIRTIKIKDSQCNDNRFIKVNYSQVIREMVDQKIAGGVVDYKFNYQNVSINGILARAAESGDLTEVKENDLVDEFNAFVKHQNS